MSQDRAVSRPSRHASDPRHYQPTTRLTDRQLGEGLTLDENGRALVLVEGALATNPDTGALLVNVADGIEQVPGSPIALRARTDGQSVQVDTDGQLIARPTAAQVSIRSREVTGPTLQEALDEEIELVARKNVADGYAGLDSRGKLDPARGGASDSVATLDSSVLVPQDQLGTGSTGLGTQVLRDDRTWGAVPAAALPSHATTHQHGGSDEVATATPAANAIPKADGSNKLAAGWMSEVLAPTDLTGVSATTGTGTTLVFQGGPSITSPKVLGSITDASGNELIEVSGTGSAVNHIIVANAATGGNPSINSAGDDPAVGLDIGGSEVNIDAGDDDITLTANDDIHLNPGDKVFVNGAQVIDTTDTASTSTAGIVVLSTDGEETSGEVVQATDNRLVKLISTTESIVRSTLPCAGTGFALTADTAYFVYLGRTTKTATWDRVRFNVRSAGSGAQTAEVGLFSTPNAPARAGQTLTKLVASGSVDDLTSTGPKANTSDFSTSVAAGTHLWAGVRTNMASTQPSIFGLLLDLGHGRVLQMATAGALTASNTFTGAIPTDASATLAPDLHGALD